MYSVNGLMFATNQSVKGRRCEGQGFVIFIVNIIIVKVKKCGELFMTPCQFYGPREDLTNGPKENICLSILTWFLHFDEKDSTVYEQNWHFVIETGKALYEILANKYTE